MAYFPGGPDGANLRNKTFDCAFIFREVKILRDRNPIGQGAYGAVYYAKCDSLLCAAKCIHDVFFDQEDEQRDYQLRAFYSECEMMASMKHPNIVQYLGYYKDRATNMPCLLMELLDESLTHYLNRLAGPVPFHTSIDFAHDISMALDYLHKNDRMHRDLTSNNVLILASSRAKVTDFGQSILVMPESNYRVKGDLCPGNMVYMPPEALKANPVYSSNLDSFSFGVLLIQILTRLFPAPKESTMVMPEFGPGKTDAIIPVQELMRRRNHIAMVDPHHPLLELALYCIKDDEELRPTFYELTERLSELKHIPEYDYSQKENPGASPRPQISSLNPENDRRIVELQKKLERLEEDNNVLRGQVTQMRLVMEKKDAIIEQMQDSGHRGHLSGPRSLGSSAGATPSVPPSYQPNTGSLPSSINSSQSLNSSQGSGSASPLPVPKFRVGNKTLQWFPCTRLPSALYSGSAVTVKDKIYTNGQGLNGIFELDASRNKWSSLPPAPTASFALVEIKGVLTTVGGYTPRAYTNALYSLVLQNNAHVWQSIYPPMKEARINAGAVATRDYLIVAGGEIQAPRNRFVSWNVEAMQIDTRQWMTVDKMPKPAKRFSMAVQGNNLYVCGGVTRNNQPLREIFFVRISDLISSAAEGFASRALKSTTCWEGASLPIVYATCAVVNEQLLVLGGWDNQPSATIHAMNTNPQTGQVVSWLQVGKLPLARFDAMASTLPGHRLVVIGGRGQIPGQAAEQTLDAAEMACPTE